MYKKIQKNKAIGSVKIFDGGPNASSPCDCRGDNPCGPDSSCLNRALWTECHPSVCRPNCANQDFQKHNTPPLYPFYTGGKGWGLKSRAPIKKGTFVVEYCGELIDGPEFQRRLKAKQDAGDVAYYFLTLDNQRIIDAGPSGNMARFMNHCCQPNCETQKWTVLGDTRVGLFALHDIPADTELTFNYQLECAQDMVNESNQRKQPCGCGAPNCAGFIGAKPKPLETDKVSGRKSLKAKKPKQRKAAVKAPPAKKMTEDSECFICDEGGSLVLCDVKGCRKVYHATCLDAPVPETGHWTCPWHNCDVCGVESTKRCASCPSSLCPAHAAETDWKVKDLCDKHHAQLETPPVVVKEEPGAIAVDLEVFQAEVKMESPEAGVMDPATVVKVEVDDDETDKSEAFPMETQPMAPLEVNVVPSGHQQDNETGKSEAFEVETGPLTPLEVNVVPSGRQQDHETDKSEVLPPKEEETAMEMDLPTCDDQSLEVMEIRTIVKDEEEEDGAMEPTPPTTSPEPSSSSSVVSIISELSTSY